MSRVKPPVKYQAVSLHAPLLEEIKDCIRDKKRYRSIAEFVRDAIREKLYWERWVDKGKIKKRDLLPAAWESYQDFMIRSVGGNPSDYYPDDEPAMEKEQSNTDVVKEISDMKKKLDAILHKLEHDSEK